MSDVIRIEHSNPLAETQVEIEISLGNVCNYACSYCPASLHDGSTGWIPRDDIKRFLDAVEEQYRGFSVLIQYTGGEPTQYPGFEEIIQYGSNKGFHHSMISNGSRTVRFWEKFGKFFDKIHLTFHQEFADLDHFTKVVSVIPDTVLVHVNFTMIPVLFDDICQKAELLSQHQNVSITLKPLRIDFQSELYPYTDDQMTKMKTFTSRSRKVVDTKHYRGMMNAIHDDGTTTTKAPSRFILDKDNQWKGWKCWVGIQQIAVKPNGDIFRGICRVGGKLGNVKETYNFPSEPVICDKQWCSCVTDIMTRKERLNTENPTRETT
jgi:MoaA/NifB/PqqE/SkfB family radical SAM enzyme